MELIHHLGSVADERGNDYLVRVYGKETQGGLWPGWIAFFPLDGGRVLSTDRETEQSSRAELVSWATGLTPVYLEGAFARAHGARPHDSDSMIRAADLK